MDAEQQETHQQLPPRRRSRLVLAMLAFALAAAMLVVGAHSRDLHVQRFASVAARRLEPSALRGAIERHLQKIKMPDKYARAEKKSAEDSNSKRARRQRSGGGK